MAPAPQQCAVRRQRFEGWALQFQVGTAQFIDDVGSTVVDPQASLVGGVEAAMFRAVHKRYPIDGRELQNRPFGILAVPDADFCADDRDLYTIRAAVSVAAAAFTPGGVLKIRCHA